MSEIENYLACTSPLSRLANKKNKPFKQINNSVTEKMRMMADCKKSYVQDSSDCSFAELKASSIIYNIPEFSPPEINYEIAQKLREKINTIKSDIVTKLPSIKSSNYSPSRVDSFMSHRTVIKELQDWLRVKLQNPPTTHEDSIQYKNMIMGIGMKEVIRLIGTRCTEQANTVNQIWELTWGICREIILYLSKRARKCEQILDEQIGFLRKFYDDRLIENDHRIRMLSKEKQMYHERSDKVTKDLSNLKKKHKALRLNFISIEDLNVTLKQEFESILQENLMMHLQSGGGDDKKKTDWVRRMYANLVCKDKGKNSEFKNFMIKIMKDNNYILDNEEFGDFELTNDINKLKEQQQMRRSIIAMELHQTFKKTDSMIQTDAPVLANTGITTNMVVTTSTGITAVCELAEVGVITNETVDQATKKPKGVKTIQKLKTDRLIKKPTAKDKQTIPHQQEEQREGKKLFYDQSEAFSSIEVQTEGHEFLNSDGYRFNQYGHEKPATCHIPSKVSQKLIASNKSIPALDAPPKGHHYSKSIDPFKKEGMFVGKSNKNISDMASVRFEESVIGYGQFSPSDYSPEHSIKMHEASLPSHAQQQEKIEKLRQSIVELERNYQQKLEYNQKLLNQKNAYINRLNRELQEKKEGIAEMKERIEGLMTVNSSEAKDDQEIDNLDGRPANQSIGRAKQYGRDGREDRVNEHLLRQRRSNPDRRAADKSIPQSRKNVIISGSYHRQSSDHRKSALILDGAIERALQKSYPSEAPSRNQSKSQSIAYNFIQEQSQKQKESSIKGGMLCYREVCRDYVEMKMINQERANFVRLPEIPMEPYRQLLRQVMDDPERRTQKNMRSVVEKTIPSILKELSKDIQQGTKANRLEELKANFSSLPTIIVSRFNRNFGVRKVAQKHLRDLLLCLKNIQPITQTYEIVWYFMRGENNQQNIDLLFFYILLLSLLGPNDKIIYENDLEYIVNLARDHLTSDSEFLAQINLKDQKKAEEATLSTLFKKIVLNYNQYVDDKNRSLSFLFHTLTWTHPTVTLDILTHFISIFPHDPDWNHSILNELTTTFLNEKQAENGLNQKQFFRFVNRCSLSLGVLIRKLKNSCVGMSQMQFQSGQLVDMSRKSHLAACLTTSLLKQSHNPGMFSEEQESFLASCLALLGVEEGLGELLGCLSFFQGRSTDVMVRESQTHS